VAPAPVDTRPAVRGTLFYKMTGSGNDFVVLDGRSTTPDQWPAAQVRAVCDRRTGVGADGLVILTPVTGGVRMSYWNSDGSHGAMCGNAALCSGKLSVHLELVPAGEFPLFTDAGVVKVRSSAEDDTAEISLPDFEVPREVPALKSGPGERWLDLGTIGVPHLVVRVENVEQVDVVGRGRILRNDSNTGPVGANVNFVSHDGSPQHPWLIRTFERGVEGETLACGTGTVAAAAALAARGEAGFPIRFRSRGGPELVVRGKLEGSRGTEVWLGGQGRLVFRGVWEGR
jgi:diaminopimelate epimerase